VATLSSQSIASPSSAANGGVVPCGGCDAPLAADQRYCLECGERHPQTSEFLMAGPPLGAASAPASAPAGPPAALPPALGGPATAQERGNTVTVIAGVGVLLLAIGVGVLIGRSSAAATRAARAQVITVGSATGGGANAAAPESSSDEAALPCLAYQTDFSAKSDLL
jgi:hypothetical protein